ncbi:MAG: hypothetical protein ACXWUU_18815 [Burkholderiales bacterium]
MDRAIWITWYNLPPEAKDEYLSWLHLSYMPRVLARPDVQWGAHYASEENVVPLGGGQGRVRHSAGDIPPGDRYILLFGAAEPRAFTDPGPSVLHADLPEADRRMLRLRTDERVNVMIDEARVLGPSAGKPHPATTPSACIQLGSFNAATYADEEELARWYAQWRLPSMQSVPGCVRVRKLVSIAGWAKHACFYEFASVEERNEHFVHYEVAHPEMEAWSKAVVKKLVHAPGSPNLARRLCLLANT